MIFGHSRQIEYLNKALKRARLAHAYLFYGPSRVGKFTVAKSLAKAICCPNHRSSISIELSEDECKNCQMIEGNVHPQVLVLDTEHTLVSKKETRKDIPIGDIRELKRRFSFETGKDDWRIAIINEAEKMSDEASNAFLKLLEEPGKNTLFLLVAESPELLPPTIVSRAQSIRFSHAADSVLEQLLKSRVKNESARKEIFEFAAGRPGVAIELSRDQDLLEKERKFKKMFTAAVEGEIHDIFGFTEKIHADADLRVKAAGYLMNYMRNNMLKDKSSGVNFTEKIKRINEISTILETTNVNPRLALDVMLMEGRL